MTREEAIDYLQDAKSALPHKFDKALDMAIEALSTLSGDLISRADAMAEFRECVKRANENGETPTWNDAVSLIGSLPSADADVVRCKDCKQRRVEGDCTHYYYCDFLGSLCRDNEYCSFGERREP